MKSNALFLTTMMAFAATLSSASTDPIPLTPERCEMLLGKELVLPKEGRYSGRANFSAPRDFEASRVHAQMTIGWGQDRHIGSLEVAEEFLEQLRIPVEIRKFEKLESVPAAAGLELDLDVETSDFLVHALRQLRSEWKKIGGGRFPRIFIAEKKDLTLLETYLGRKPILIDPTDLRDYLVYGYFPPSLRHDLRLASFDITEGAELAHAREFFHGVVTSARKDLSASGTLRTEESIVASHELHESLVHFGEVFRIRRSKGSYTENLRLAFRQVDQQFRFLVNTVGSLERSFSSLSRAREANQVVLSAGFWRPRATAIWLDEKGRENSLTFACAECRFRFWGKKEVAAADLDRILAMNLDLLAQVQKEIEAVAPFHRALNEEFSKSPGEWFMNGAVMHDKFVHYRDAMNRARRRLTLELARISRDAD